MTVLAAHQPNYLPWAGFMDKIARSDIFVISGMDLFSPKGYVHRNCIMVNGSPTWLTVPVGKPSNTFISDLPLRDDLRWREKHWKTIKAAYARSPFFPDIERIVEPLYREDHDFGSFEDVSVAIIRNLVDYFGIRTRVVRVTDRAERNQGKMAIITFCKDYGADTYLSGPGGRDYMTTVPMQEHKLNIEWQPFDGTKFQGLSILHFIANEGKKALPVIELPRTYL